MQRNTKFNTGKDHNIGSNQVMTVSDIPEHFQQLPGPESGPLSPPSLPVPQLTQLQLLRLLLLLPLRHQGIGCVAPSPVHQPLPPGKQPKLMMQCLLGVTVLGI